ncbi:MAG: hypothetical protein GX774_11125 [Armatimonadetes bacterium]|nr:hypothetical protein [Armatimonadota bacterium]
MRSYRLAATGLLLGVLVGAAAPPARAEWRRPQVGTVMLGVYLPQDEAMRQRWGEVWPCFQYHYDVRTLTGATHRFGLGITGTTREAERGFLEDFDGFTIGTYHSDVTFVMVPLSYTLLYTPPLDRGGPYVGGGAGLHLGWSEVATRYKLPGVEDREADSWFSARGALHAVAGYAFPGGLRVDVRYVKMLGSLTVLRLDGKDTTANADGIQVSLGLRF